MKHTPPPYVSTYADISGDGLYRYSLSREWRGCAPRANWRWFGEKDGAGHELGEPKPCVFIMLNPSTADGKKDDPTIRRCVAFAKRWKYDQLSIVNLFAYRTSSPAVLTSLHHSIDPSGLRNQEAVWRAVFDAGIVIAAWGAHGSHMEQDDTVRGWLPDDLKLYCLGRTKEGMPKHPLARGKHRIPDDFEPIPFL